ncbi:pyridoxamine 5'-phosphate oxidase family protein [candidate division WOR-3 bacterium]|nr:pyridoxamine 5'-phosphate oxidase family protein [candidate division WOR-3 bacterium]
MSGSGDLKQEVRAHFNGLQIIHLATMDGSIPRVRPVTLIHFDKKMWVMTGSRDAKIRQIKKNQNVEFCLLLKAGEHSGYVRCAGQAEIVKDAATRKSLADSTPFFKEFWKTADDPGYTLLRMHAREIEYVKPGTLKAERFSLA